MNKLVFESTVPYREPSRRYATANGIDIHQLQGEIKEHEQSGSQLEAAEDEFHRLLSLVPTGYEYMGNRSVFFFSPGEITVRITAYPRDEP